MRSGFQDLRILDSNLEWFGYPVLEAMEKAGRGLASEIEKALKNRDEKNKGKKKSETRAKIAFFCGPGNKGGDGFVAARYLSKKHEVTVFPSAKPKTMEAQKNFKRLEKTKAKIKRIGREYPKEKSDVYVDALLGTGLEGELREPYASLVKWLNAQRGFKVAVDVPTGWGTKLYFRDDITVSMHCSKKKGAKVVDVGIPRKLEGYVGPGQVKALVMNKGERKGQNGVLTVIGGSRKYHGAPLYAIEAAAPFVDLIYFYSPRKENLELKKKTKAFITLEKKELTGAIEKSDCVLTGNGLEENKANERLVNSLLAEFPHKKFVLDAGAMMLADKKLFDRRVVLTPHAGEFKRCFGKKASAQEAKMQALGHKCIILLKGPVDIITDGRKTFRNFTGNRGMTRGGTGDVLAGLVAALATQNGLFISAQAGAFLNGLAGDLVAKEKKAFTADDVARKLPEAYGLASKF